MLSVDQHVDLTFFFLFEMFHTFDRIVHGISKNRVQIHRVQKFQSFSVCHTGNYNIICLTCQTFFCQDRIQNIIAGLDHGFVNLDRILDFFNIFLPFFLGAHIPKG